MGTMDGAAGKIFIGGLSWETTNDSLQRYFSRYGEIIDSVIMKDKGSGHPRGFGFVTFAEPGIVDRVLQDKHVLDGRTVEAKRAVSKESMAARGPKTKKIFVGGLASATSEAEFRRYFEQFGKVVESQIMHDHETGRPRGFGFVTFASEDDVENVISRGHHEICNKTVEIKKAEPKQNMLNRNDPRLLGRGPLSPYNGFGLSPYNSFGLASPVAFPRGFNALSYSSIGGGLGYGMSSPSYSPIAKGMYPPSSKGNHQVASSKYASEYGPIGGRMSYGPSSLVGNGYGSLDVGGPYSPPGGPGSAPALANGLSGGGFNGSRGPLGNGMGLSSHNGYPGEGPWYGLGSPNGLRERSYHPSYLP